MNAPNPLPSADQAQVRAWLEHGCHQAPHTNGLAITAAAIVVTVVAFIVIGNIIVIAMVTRRPRRRS